MIISILFFICFLLLTIFVNAWIGLVLILCFVIYQIYLHHKNPKKISRFLGCCWLLTLISFETYQKVAFLWLSLFIFFIFVYFLFKMTRDFFNKWYKYTFLFLFSVVFWSILTSLQFYYFQLELGLSNNQLITIIYGLSIITPLIYIILEEDKEVQLKEIKVGVYFWIAIITITSSFSFLYHENLEAYFEKTVGLTENEKSKLPILLKNDEFTEKLEIKLNEYDISYKNCDNKALNPDQLSENIIEAVHNKFETFTDFLIKIFFLPHIIGGVLATFMIGLSEKEDGSIKDRMKYIFVNLFKKIKKKIYSK